MERYLGGEEIDQSVLIDDLEKAVARGSFFPVIPVCSSTGVGTLELLEIATSGFPSPAEHQLPEVFTPQGASRNGLGCDPNGPLLAEVVKTTSDPYVGRVSLVRVFSGTIRPDATVHVSGHFSSFFGSSAASTVPSTSHADHDEDERIGTLSFPLGKQQRPAPSVVAGDICAIGRLSRAETGDTLSDKSDPLVLKPWTMPEPLLPIAVQPRAKTDEDKLSVGFAAAGRRGSDAAHRAEPRNPSDRAVVHGRGPCRRGSRRACRAGTALPWTPSNCGCRCGKRSAARQKATAGTSNSPADMASTRCATSRSSRCRRAPGSSSSTRWSAARCRATSSRASRRASARRWKRASARGYPVVDIRVTLFDGKAHSVDSSDFAFQMAGGLALREAAAATKVNLLEPVDVVSVLVPDDLVGTVMGDLAGRRGRVLGTDKVGEDRTLVKAEIPEVELTRYAIDLRSLSHGAGSFTRSFARYEPMPESAASKVKTSV